MYSLTGKQKEVLRAVREQDPSILILSGAKRAGKTFVLNLAFLSHVSKFKNKNYNFILGGTTHSSIRRNVLNDWEEILGREIKLNKYNSFNLFGNRIYVLDGADKSSYKKARGFTAHGAMLNEATTLHDSFVKEVLSRCSGAGARIYMDTNPENPLHTVKIDYIDKSGTKLTTENRMAILAFHFTLYDNEFLSPEYIETIEKSTPAGMFYERDILGRWVNSEGVVYAEFNHNKHIVNSLPIIDINGRKTPQIKRYFAGVDWGYQHYGSIVVMGMGFDGKVYLVKEIASQYKEAEWWVNEAQKVINEYGNIPFYCDSARPDLIAKFRNNKIKAFNANKSVMAGISLVAGLIKQDRFLIVNPSKIKLKVLEELSLYSWNEKTGEPIKTNDDVLDSVRYGIYSDSILNNKEYERG